MGSMRRYLLWVKPYKWAIIGTIFIGVIKFAIPLLIPLIIKYVVDNIVGGTMTVEEKKEQLLAALERAGIDPRRRGETLTIEEFGRLSDELLADFKA